MSRNPFIVIPWDQDFLQPTLDLALEEGSLADAVFIFPHQRAEQYLTHHIIHHPNTTPPLILPKCYTVSTLFSHLRQALIATPAWDASLLDTIGLLLHCVRKDAQALTLSPNATHHQSAPDTEHFLHDAALFFPWGTRLASLFEECFTQQCYPSNFDYMETEVSPFAAHLLSRLAALFEQYTQGLAKSNWTTAGFDALQVTEKLQAGAELPIRFFQNKRIYLAGFHALSKTEDTLFRHLWQHYDTTVLVHADAHLIPTVQKKAHWSCNLIKEWAKRWQTSFTALPDSLGSLAASTKASAQQPIQYYQGFDLHSQLEKAQEVLEQGTQSLFSPKPAQSPYSAPTAIVLPDSGLLMPALHHLPKTDINVSMGYPLSRSPLFLLLETIFTLQERRKEKGYYWHDLVELVRHPYIKMLEPAPSNQEITTAEQVYGSSDSEIPLQIPTATHGSIRKELHKFEQAIRTCEKKFPVPYTIWQNLFGLEQYQENLPTTEVLQLLDTIFATTLYNFESPRTPHQLGVALEHLCRLLLEHGAHLWDRFLIDAECLHRLMQSTIPELLHSSLSHEVFPLPALISMARQLLEAERVPFEANPLVGMQVMGMLETRLLTFETLLLFDTTEDNLPGTSLGNPLLPDPLRPLLGLPPLHTREQVTAYHFFRLVRSAKNIHIFWQEGMDTGTADQKKVRSRFVEELLWQQEKVQGQLISQHKPHNYTVLETQLTALPTACLQVHITPLMAAQIQQQIRPHVSATLIDAYLRCPVRFYYEHILQLREADEVSEGDDSRSVGIALHEAMQSFYTKHLHTPFAPNESNHHALTQELLNCLYTTPTYFSMAESLPADALAMFKAAAGIRLSNYMQNHPSTCVIGLETPLSAPLLINDTHYTLKGKIDRIDLRNNELFIIDYKTGKISTTSPTFWDNVPLWNKITHWTPNVDPTENSLLLQEISAGINSIQLPFYLHLFQNAAAQLPEMSHIMRSTTAQTGNAAFIALGEQGQEYILFPDTAPALRHQRITVQLPQLISFIIRNMEQSSTYLPVTGDGCGYCPSKRMCLQQKS